MNMSTRMLRSLAVLAIALPTFAQQSNSGSGTQPAVSATQSTSDQSLRRQDFWDGDEPSLGALIFHPMATKEYVKRHTEPIRDRINELEEITSANSKTIRDIDARSKQGIQMASAKADVADQHATDATNKAQMAHQGATAADKRVRADEVVVNNLDQYKSGAQTEIRFRPGQTVLSKEAKDALDEMAAPLKNSHGFIIEVQGFSAGQGQMAMANSRKIADSVVRYLVLNHEIPAYRIYVIGLGNAEGVHGTRVEVNVLKNELEAARE
jgi:outer membrane protein OmpA-like peptidoglycan-associated protein